MIQDIPTNGVRGNTQIAIRHIAIDSRRCCPGSLFIACRGVKTDGHRYVKQALSKGSVALLVERWVGKIPSHITQVKCSSTGRVLAKVAARFQGFPAQKLDLLGVTGTNGKSTTAALLAHLLSAQGGSTGLIGTVGYKMGKRSIPATHTTPDALRLQKMLAGMVRRGMSQAVIEVSSHALDQGRVDEIPFKAAIFTNLTREHLDYHKTMSRYFVAKKKLFKKKKTGDALVSVVNIDDPYGRRLVQSLSGPRWTYAIGRKAELRAHVSKLSLEGSHWVLEWKNKRFSVKSPLVGLYNVSNSLAAIGGGLVSYGRIGEWIKAIKTFSGVPGRLERMSPKGPFHVFVDYAHTEDALGQVLRTLRGFKPRRLITVFGCGGDRDRGKRPRMGRIASDWADQIILTSDNPRGEDPVRIMADIQKGIRRTKKCQSILDRKEALYEAVRQAGRGDVVLVAGKGHETTQVLKNRVLPFDDRKILLNLIGQKIK